MPPSPRFAAGAAGAAGPADKAAAAAVNAAASAAVEAMNAGRYDEAIAKFALAYAPQTEQDHAALDKARRAGRITVAAGKVV